MNLINDGVPQAIYDAIIKINSEYDGDLDNSISVTTLIDSPLIAYYSRKYKDIETKATDELWKLLGSAMHSVLEKSNSSLVKEMRLGMKIKDYYLHGKCDVYDVANQSIEDYKFIGYTNLVKYPKYEHTLQLNVLSYIFKHNGLPVKQLKVHYIWRNLTNYDLQKEDYPNSFITTYDVPMTEESYLENYINKKMKLHINSLKGNPQECSLEERWGYIKYKIYNVNNMSKAIKVFDDIEIAGSYLKYLSKNKDDYKKYIIKEVKEETKRCRSYCKFKNVCDLYKRLTNNNN